MRLCNLRISMLATVLLSTASLGFAQDTEPVAEVESVETRDAEAAGAARETRAEADAADFGIPNMELFLEAGRQVPPGLAATRVRERELEREAALNLLRAELSSTSDRRENWMLAFGAILESRAARNGIWPVAANLVGELDLYEFNQALMAGFESADQPYVQLVAARTLTRLYGTKPIAGVAFLPPFSPNAETKYLLRLLRRSEQRVLDLQKSLLAENVERALSAIGSSFPEVRLAAALELSDAAAKGSVDSDRLWDVLLEAIGTEASADAFHAELDALLDLCRGLAPDGVKTKSLRDLLLRKSAEVPEAFLLGLAKGISRLKWEPGDDRPQTNLRAAGRYLSTLLSRMADARYGDEDVTSGVLNALDVVFNKVENLVKDGRGDAGDWLRGSAARQPSLQLLGDSNQSDTVRRRAAGVLSKVALAEDIGLMLAVLKDEDTQTGLKYELLGTVESLLGELTSMGGYRVVKMLFDFLENPQVDLRRRALFILGSNKVKHFVRKSDLGRILSRLEVESIKDLKSSLLLLLRQYGGPEALEPLLTSASFDALALSDTALVGELAEALSELSNGNPKAVMESATRMAVVDEDVNRTERLVQCLRLVAELAEAEARSLSPDQHELVVGWVQAVRFSGIQLQDSLENGEVFLNRLIDIHLPLAVASEEPSDSKWLYTRALLLRDLAVIGSPELADEAREHFTKALRTAERQTNPILAARIRRDRARFSLNSDRRVIALDDLSVLFAEPDWRNLLELSDLRTLVVLQTELATEAERAGTESLAFTVLYELVNRAAWRDDIIGVRLNDVTMLVDHAIATADEANINLVLGLLAELPSGTEAGESIASDEVSALPAIWNGLDRDPDQLQTLQELESKLKVASSL
ncbi:MAG: hypothetical protein ACI8TQ_001630 [Planctomycetota bacterium]|jgi:hypothetical protein